MNKITKEIYNEVKNRCILPSNIYGVGAWDHHIKLVYEIVCKIYCEYGANLEVVSLAALLHDIASVTDEKYTEDHHIYGAKMAEEILKNYDISDKKIEHIKKCILNHRGSKVMEKLSPEEICVADADAMAHFYSIPSLLKMVYVEKKMGIDEGSKFVLDKLERSYNKLSNRGKKIVKNKYESAKEILIINK